MSDKRHPSLSEDLHTGSVSASAYAVDIVVVEGFHITELAEIVDCVEVLKGLDAALDIKLSLASPHGGPIRGSCRDVTVDTIRAPSFSGRGVVVMPGAAGAEAHGAQLARLWMEARRQGRHPIAFSETVAALKRRGVFGDDVVCTHWSDPIMQEARWSEEISDTTIFHIDDRYSTGAGRSSAVHLILNVISREFGPQIVHRISEQLLVGDLRTTTSYQRFSVQDRYLVDEPRIVKMLEIMEEEIEEKLSMSTIARRLGISTRQLERLCRRHLGTPPLRTLEIIRMRKARWLLERTALPIIEIALTCGFSNPSLFSKCFRRHYSVRPQQIRQAHHAPSESILGFPDAPAPACARDQPSLNIPAASGILAARAKHEGIIQE